MQVTYTLDESYEIPKNIFVFTLETMTGDDDDHHNIEIPFENEEDIKELVVAAEIAIEMRGDAGGKLFEKYFSGGIYSNDYGCNDRPIWYEIVWYDSTGNRFKVTTTIDDEMKLQIANPDLSSCEDDDES